MNILLVVCPAYPEIKKLLSVAGKISSALGAKTTALCVGSGVSQKYYSPFSIQLGIVNREVERKIFEEINVAFGGKDVVKIIRAGEPATQVLEEIEKGDYGMLILEDVDRKLTMKIAEYSHVPTLIFRRGEKLKSFLVCTDGSENSLRVARFAGRLAKSLGASLGILSVAKSEEERASAEEAIRKARSVLAEISVRAEEKVKLGSVREAILAEGRSYDVLALSPRGLSKLERVLLGHVSLHVLEKADSSVLLVR